MKKDSRITTLSIVEVMVSIAWIIIVLIFAKSGELAFYLWGGFIFAIMAFVLTFMGMFFFTEKRKKIGVEISGTPYYFLCAYYIVSLVLNTIFAFTYNGGKNRFVFIGNIVLFVIYASILLYANSYIEHMVHVSETLAAKTVVNDNYRINLSNLITMARTEKEKNSLKKLKEMVDYSSNINVAGGLDKEKYFIEKLNEIYALMSQNAPEESVVNAIQEAITIWQGRNIAVINK